MHGLFVPYDQIEETRKAINTKSIFGIKKNKYQENYLGLPLINGRVTKKLFNNIVTKMDQRLFVWYNKYLSLTERTVLINSTFQTIPYYAVAAFNLPKGIKQGIQGKMKHYFWNSFNYSKQKAKPYEQSLPNEAHLETSCRH